MDHARASAGPSRADRRRLRLEEGCAVGDPLDPSVHTPVPADAQALSSPRNAGHGRYLKTHCIARKELASEEADAALVSIWLGIANRKGRWSSEAYHQRTTAYRSVSEKGNARDGSSPESATIDYLGHSPPKEVTALHNRRMAELNADVLPLSRQGPSGSATSRAATSASTSTSTGATRLRTCASSPHANRPHVAAHLRRSAQGSDSPATPVEDTAQSRFAPSRPLEAAAASPRPIHHADGADPTDTHASGSVSGFPERPSGQPAEQQGDSEALQGSPPSAADRQQEAIPASHSHFELTSSGGQGAPDPTETPTAVESRQENGVEVMQDDCGVMFYHETPRVPAPADCRRPPANSPQVQPSKGRSGSDYSTDPFELPLNTFRTLRVPRPEHKPREAAAVVVPVKKETLKKKAAVKAMEKVKQKLSKIELFAKLRRKGTPKKAKGQARSASAYQPKPSSRGGNPRANPKAGPWTPGLRPSTPGVQSDSQQQSSQSRLSSSDLRNISGPLTPNSTVTHTNSVSPAAAERFSLDMASSPRDAELLEMSDLVRAEESMDVGNLIPADMHFFMESIAFKEGKQEAEEHLGEGISIMYEPMPELPVCETPRLPGKPVVPAPARLVPAAPGQPTSHCCPETAKERLYEAAGFDPTHVFEEKGWFDPFSAHNKPLTSSLPVCWETFLANRGQVESPGCSVDSSNASKSTVEIRCSQIVSRSLDDFSVAGTPRVSTGTAVP